MSKANSNAEAIAKVFLDYCTNKKYQAELSEEANNLRIDISNLSERTIVKIYNNNRIQIQGKQNMLNDEMDALKAKLEADPQSVIGHAISEVKACATIYDIMLPDLRVKVRSSLVSLGAIEITNNPSSAIEYRAKITKKDFSMTLTQYNNGTLLLQGKNDSLFDECCTIIEKIADPSDKEVIARFISNNEASLEQLAAKYTPQLLEVAENNVKNKIGGVYGYLESYDRKWFVASECLCITKIPLPEYSPFVMPASKAFEGFAKKLLVGIGLFDPAYFKQKSANFSALNDTANPKRKSICDKEKYADTMLKKISLCLETNRNFMMHSDESKITKINTQEEAEKKVNEIFGETRMIFEYFSDIYKLY